MMQAECRDRSGADSAHGRPPRVRTLLAGGIVAVVILAVGALAAAVLVQEPEAPAGKQARPAETPRTAQDPAPAADGASAVAAAPRLSWPRDKDRVVAEAAGRDLTLDELVQHVTERHDPQFRSLLATASGAAYFQSPLAAQWVRHYADVVALAAEAKLRKIPRESSEAALSAALKSGFQDYLAQYTHGREHAGRPLQLSQARVNDLLSRYQREFGLGVERQGWLDVLVPNDFPEPEVWEFYQQHPGWFGGRIDLAHVLVQHRDAETGQLLPEAERRTALARVEDVKRRLMPDGSNFDVVARAMSDDKRSAIRGGEFENVERFDARLPSALTKAAWDLKDGEWTGPIETPYGFHFVRRLRYHAAGAFVYAPSNRGEVQQMMWRDRQEQTMDAVRANHGVKLHY